MHLREMLPAPKDLFLSLSLSFCILMVMEHPGNGLLSAPFTPLLSLFFYGFPFSPQKDRHFNHAALEKAHANASGPPPTK